MMSEVKPDWNEAPEWADRVMGLEGFNYWCSVSNYAEFDWYKVSGEERRFEVRGVTIGDFELIEMRPEIKPEVWDDGLPPVGCECEVSNHDNIFEKCVILFMGKEMCVVNHPQFRAIEQHYHLNSVVFRKPKTQEEKDRDAFIERGFLAAKESVIGWGEDESTAFLEDLFDDGARFTTPKGDK